MLTKPSFLTQAGLKENPKHRFTRLIDLITEDFLTQCFWELERDKAPGVDGVTVKEYEANLEENLKDLVARMKVWRYRPQPVRRAYIPKPNGKQRPLGIPAVEDKIVQMAIKKILEPIFEVDFKDVSFGFRPKRSCHDALDAVDKAVMTKPINVIVDMDIEKFFDTVDHKWLMKFLKQRIADKNLLRLIGRFLKAGVMEEGKYYQTDKGTPQGGIISPLLANIYLHYVSGHPLAGRLVREGSQKGVKRLCSTYSLRRRLCSLLPEQEGGRRIWREAKGKTKQVWIKSSRG